MGRLIILNLPDGDQIGKKLAAEMKAFSDSVEEKSFYDWNHNDSQTECVTVVILSTLVCQDLNLITLDAWKKLLTGTPNTLLLVSCKSEGENAFRALCRRLDVDEATLQIHNVKLDETAWYTAEGQLKVMLSAHVKRGSFSVPKEQRFTIRPNTIQPNTAEVTIVLFEDYPQTRSMSAAISDGKGSEKTFHKCTKLRNGVWTLDTKDLKPGDYTVQVQMDDTDVGKATLTIQDDLDAIIEPLIRTAQTDPRRILSRLLQIDEKSFDKNLSALLQKPATELLAGLYRGLFDNSAPENKGLSGSQDVLDFLTKYDCNLSMEIAKKHLSNRMSVSYDQNEAGGTPPEVSSTPKQKIRTKEQDAYSDEEPFADTRSPLAPETFAATTSPLAPAKDSKSGRSSSVGSRASSSGVSSGGSVGSEGRMDSFTPRRRIPSDGIGRESILIAEREIKQSKLFSQSMKVTRKERVYDEIPDIVSPSYNQRREHPYESVLDEPAQPRPITRPKSSPYDVPWERTKLPQWEFHRRPEEQETEITML